jgi:hypothetical protein
LQHAGERRRQVVAADRQVFAAEKDITVALDRTRGRAARSERRKIDKAAAVQDEACSPAAALVKEIDYTAGICSYGGVVGRAVEISGTVVVVDDGGVAGRAGVGELSFAVVVVYYGGVAGLAKVVESSCAAAIVDGGVTGRAGVFEINTPEL